MSTDTAIKPTTQTYSERNRSRVARWVAPGPGAQPAVELRVTHFASSKAYVVSAQPMTHDEQGGVSSYNPMESERLNVIRVSRYSQAKLAELFCAALSHWPTELPEGTEAARVWKEVADALTI